MGIYLRNMEMPKGCDECMCNSGIYCNAMPINFCGYTEDEDIPEWCPLVEVPPHGDLVDRNNLLEKAYYDYNEATHDYNKFRVVFEDDIIDAPVVIEGNL